MELSQLKEYLNELDHLNLYEEYIKNKNLKDNLTNIKLYFNTNIFISIVDFKNKTYNNVFSNKTDFKKYLSQNPGKILNKNLVKQEKKYRIFLR